MIKRDPTKGWPRTTSQVISSPMVIKATSNSDYSLFIGYSPYGSLYVEGPVSFAGGTTVYNGLNVWSSTTMLGYHNASVGALLSADTSRDTGGVSSFRVNYLGDVLIKSSTDAPQSLKIETQGATSESLVIQDLRDSSIVLSIDVDGNFSGTSAATTWKSFTPVLSGSTWAIGNGVLAGTYSKIGKTVHFSIELIFGSTSVYGTGTPQISITPAGVTSGAVAGTSFNATYTDDSTGNRYAGRGVLQLGSLGAPHMYTLASPMTTLTDTVPFTWATGDSIAMTGTYQTV